MLQAKDELRTGHLQRFLDTNIQLFDRLYAVDDASVDGTREVLVSAGAHVIPKTFESFKRELVIKNQLLSTIREFEEPGTWVVRLDADEVVFASRKELESLIVSASQNCYDSIALHHLNLWRTERHVRTDDGFESFNPVRIWRLGAEVNFPDKQGLHITSDPIGLKKTKYSSEFPVVHFGFASDESIIQKAVSYWSLGQKGYALNRLLLDSDATFHHLDSYADVLGERYLREQKPGVAEPLKGDLPLKFNMELADRQQQPRLTLICLIFSGIEWLEFQYGELLKLAKEFRRGYVEILFVANDPTPEVQVFLKDNGIPHKVFHGSKEPGEWYINSVYRAYNFGVSEAKGELVLLTNSDMAYAPGFLSNMLEMFDPKKLNTARLIESGRLPTGELGIEKDFGSRPKKFRRHSFNKYAKKIKASKTIPGGLFMPLLIKKRVFTALGGFPEGNVKADDLKNYLSGEPFSTAKKNEPLVPGDNAFFKLADQMGFQHQTIANSIAYHFQEGELQSSRGKSLIRSKTPSGLAVINDSIYGVSGEPVFWSKLGEWLSDEGFRIQFVESGRPTSPLAEIIAPFKLWLLARAAFSREGTPRLVFQNASYQLPAPTGISRVSFVQDRPESQRLKLLQKLCVQRSELAITNDISYFEHRSGKKLRWLPIPLSDFWWKRGEHKEHITIKDVERVLFVGQMNQTKGWTSILSTMRDSKDVSWRLILKDDKEDLSAFQEIAPASAKVFNGQNQQEMKRHYVWADLLLSASPHETQHLASLEAISQNTPVLTTPTGLLGLFGKGKHDFGLVSECITADILHQMKNQHFSPRAFLEQEILENDALRKLWLMELQDQMEQTFTSSHKDKRRHFVGRLRSAVLDVYRRLKRRLISRAQRLLRKS